jgi:excisionase family DNA binding protein
MPMAAPSANIDPDLWDRIVDLTHGRLLIPQTEVCRAFGITSETLTQEIEAGRLRYVLVGKRRKFKPSDIAHYIERQTRSGDQQVEKKARPAMQVLNPPIDFAEAVRRTEPMFAAKREAARAKKAAEAKRHEAWLRAQRRLGKDKA